MYLYMFAWPEVKQWHLRFNTVVVHLSELNADRMVISSAVHFIFCWSYTVPRLFDKSCIFQYFGISMLNGDYQWTVVALCMIYAMSGIARSLIASSWAFCKHFVWYRENNYRISKKDTLVTWGQTVARIDQVFFCAWSSCSKEYFAFFAGPVG